MAGAHDVLVAGCDPLIQVLLEETLQGSGYTVAVASDVGTALARLQDGVGVIVADAALLTATNHALRRAAEEARPAPEIVVMTAVPRQSGRLAQMRGLAARARASVCAALARRQEGALPRPPGIRAEVHAALVREAEQAHRGGTPLGAVLLAVDPVPGLGPRTHEALVASLLAVVRQKARADDVTLQAGEVVVLLLPRTPPSGVEAVAARLAVEIGSRPLLAWGAPVSVTCSVGVAALDPSRVDAGAGPDLLRQALRALERARQEGAGHVVVAPATVLARAS